MTALTCYLNQLTSLNVQGLTNLTYLSCFSNQLTSLNVQGLTNLTYLYCGINKLESLNIKGAKLTVSLYYEQNLSLNYICCNEERITDIKNKAISNGQLNCEVNAYCSFTPGGKFYVLKGKNTYDNNNNGCDELDTKLTNTTYNISNGTIAGTFISNTSGNYQIPLQEGNHNITPILVNPQAFTVTPSSFQVTFPNSSDTVTQNFCITPKSTIFRQTNITVLPLTPPARPGFEAKYKIVCENAGNQIESGALNFTYDETLLDYISATLTADQIADGIVKWNFSNLLPFEKREITVTLKVNRPTDLPAVNAGDKLYLTASILDNIFTLENTVVGSYDPNDKTCLQGDRIKPDMIGKYVDYLIRFENTGNYAAENVVVKDIIDTKRFDVSSLQITDASHEVYTRIEGNKVEFIFENIQLPFDDANNDGYIAFKIKTLPTLVLGDSLKNMAEIYFDYNFPIRTNEAKTTIALSVPTADVTTDISIYPNPVRDILHISTKETWTKAEIYDISGRIMRSVALDTQTIDVSNLESGTYIIKLRNGDKSGNVKFVKM
ncbi:MAG: T9SS type A sorting domain-containing protein [Saprospiraceae bacterium]|nr:T9SS type A sorting domain-containing protein [Saprospiraceae bacterium]